MTKFGLKLVIITKIIYSKWKCVSLSVVPKYIHIIKSIHYMVSLADYGCKLTAQKRATLEVGLILLCKSWCYGYHHYDCNIYLKLFFSIKRYRLHILVKYRASIANIKRMGVLSKSSKYFNFNITIEYHTYTHSKTLRDVQGLIRFKYVRWEKWLLCG